MSINATSELAAAEAQLTRVRAAILRAMDGSAYTIGEQSVQRQRLPDLTATEAALVRRIGVLTQSIAGGPTGGPMTASFQ